MSSHFCSNFITRDVVKGQLEGQLRNYYTAAQVDLLPTAELMDCLCSGLDLSDPSISMLAELRSANVTARLHVLEAAMPHMLSARMHL